MRGWTFTVVLALAGAAAGCSSPYDSDEHRLYLAAEEGRLADVRRIIEKDPDLVNSFSTVPDLRDTKYTPLHLASRYGHKPVVEYLLEKGADLEARTNKKETPLFLAAAANHRAIAAVLIDKGADVNARDENGWTPLRVGTNFIDLQDRRPLADLLKQHGGTQ